MIGGLVVEIHIRFGLKSRVPVASKGLALHAVHATWSVSPGQNHRAYGNAKPPDLCRPSFGSGNGNSLSRLPMRIIKAVILLGVVIAIAVGMWMYFSPYNSCIREGWSQEICERGLD